LFDDTAEKARNIPPEDGIGRREQGEGRKTMQMKIK
jgi:hypothetical protein